MRTIRQALAYIKELDSGTSVTYNFIKGTSKNRFPNLDFALQIRNFTNFEHVKRIQTENSL